MASTAFSTSKGPIVIGHRGVSGHAPENSMAAFRMAAAAGIHHCDAVELDLQTTLDGQFVVHHDPVLPNGGIIAKLPLSRSATPLAMARRYRLAEALLALARARTSLWRRKSRPIQTPTCLRCYAITGRNVWRFTHLAIAVPGFAERTVISVSASFRHPTRSTRFRQVLDAGEYDLWREASLIDLALVSACHGEGILLNAWTVSNT